jgi:hypothetical protein
MQARWLCDVRSCREAVHPGYALTRNSKPTAGASFGAVEESSAINRLVCAQASSVRRILKRRWKLASSDETGQPSERNLRRHPQSTLAECTIRAVALPTARVSPGQIGPSSSTTLSSAKVTTIGPS